MLLKSVEIQGFKSFADKTVLRFGSGITAVVGPNGSGKSNITDAVRWVLGEQSAKSLRGQNMEDVIFGGTAERGPHSFAEVTLTIDNGDRSLRCDSDSVSVTRRFYRSRESEYLINRAAVRLRDVYELFMDTGLGRDGYSMIGQGKIDGIVSSKSEERRDIFEEATGISRYRYRKEDAERRLETADGNLLRLRDTLTELERRVEPLKAQSEKARRFLELEQRKKTLETGIWLAKLDGFAEALRSEENRITIAEAQYANTEKELDGIAGEIEECSRRFTELTEAIEKQTREISDLESDIARTEGEAALRENTVAHNRETLAKLNAEAENLRKSDGDASIELRNAETAVDEKRAELAEYGSLSVELTAKLEEIAGEAEGLSQSAVELGEQLNALAAGKSDLQVALVTAKTSLGEIGVRGEAIESDFAKAEKTKSTLETEQKQIAEALEKAETAITERENTLKGCELLERSYAEKLKECRAASDSAALDIGENARKVKILTDLQQNMEGYSHAVKSVVKAAKKGELNHIVGPVSEILSVPEKYATAIDVALGNAAQNIVTEDERSAKHAIEWLRNGGYGRATFLPAGTVQPRRFNAENIKTLAGFTGMASELVVFEEKYSDIIDSLLGVTAVAEDLNSAAAIAKKTGYKCKVVSLDGQVVNPGGSLTGGSVNKQAGLVGRISEIKRLKKRGDELAELANTLKTRLEKAEADLNAVREKRAEAERGLTSANDEKTRLSIEARRVRELTETAKSALISLENERVALKKRADSLNAECERTQISLSSAAAEESELRIRLNAVTSGKEVYSARRDELNERLTACRMSVAAAEKDLAALGEKTALLKRDRSEKLKRIGEITAEAEELASKNDSLLTEAKKLKVLNSEREKQIAERKQNRGIMSTERDGLGKAERELRDRELEKTAEREKLAGEKLRLLERKDRLVHENDEIIRRLFDEYGLTVSEAEDIATRPENSASANRELSEVKNKIKSLGNVNVAAIEEYEEVNGRYTFLKGQIGDIETSRRELNGIIAELTGKMRSRFTEGFDEIASNFSKTFAELFGGGKAELSLTEPDDPLTSGVDIKVRLPGKTVPSLNGLSGGEKALVAIAVYFAVMKTNPPPFCFLDEVDTALDDINVERFADYMRSSKLPTQFICVTHRRGTMEAADMLYGVTMQEKGVSKLLQLDVDELVKTLHLEENDNEHF